MTLVGSLIVLLAVAAAASIVLYTLRTGIGPSPTPRSVREVLLAEVPDVDAMEPGKLTADGDWLDLGLGGGQMRLQAGVDGGIDCDAVEGGLALRFRQGGEEFCPVGRKRSHKLKKLLQEDGVVPWMRQRIPLLYSGDCLVAVGDLWIAENASKINGYGILWRNRPALH